MNTEKSKAKNKNQVMMFAALAVAIIMIVSFVFALAQFSIDRSESSSVDEDASENAVSDSVSESGTGSEDTSDSTSNVSGDYVYYGDLQFEDYPYSDAAVKNGSLAVVKPESGYPVIDQSKILNIYAKRQNKDYGLSNTSLVLYEDALLNIDKFIAGFYQQVPANGLIIDKGYTVSDAIVSTEPTVDLTTGYSVKFAINGTSFKFSDTEFGYLRDQAYRYGVIQRYPEGKSVYTGHDIDNTVYRYVGLAHSLYMNHYMYSLEEYIDKIKTEKVIEYKSELEANVAYVIYYVPCENESGTTYVPLPTNEGCTYSVSGDGSDGFIVTVKMPIS